MSTLPHDVVRAAQAALEAERDAAGNALRLFPRLANGLTPDSTKARAEWKAAYARYNAAHDALREFNGRHAKALREIARDRSRRRFQDQPEPMRTT
jgi:hypothetical protein